MKLGCVMPGESPAVFGDALRRLALELGLDLRRIRGTERGGRVVMADLRAYIQRHPEYLPSVDMPEQR